MSFREILAARHRVYRHLQRTPLHHYPGLSALLGAQVWVKHENHLPVGAFKVRGGVNLGLQLGESVAGLYTASTGNHGQSISFAGRVAHVPVTVAVPKGANPEKMAAMRGLGAEVIEYGSDFDEAREWIAGVARDKGGRFIGPTEPELLAGYGTYALEIFEDLPDVEAIVVPVGAGGGATGCCLVAKTLAPQVRVIATQAEKAPAAYLSWKAGEPVEARMQTRAEGLATRIPFDNTQRVLREHLDDFVLVSEEAMEEAVRLLLEHSHNLAEEAGAASLAAALDQRDQLEGKKIVVVQSGGNLSQARLREILAR